MRRRRAKDGKGIVEIHPMITIQYIYGMKEIRDSFSLFFPSVFSFFHFIFHFYVSSLSIEV